ncbi:MAG: hypothetical protein LBQ74_14175 [Prevotella sp.]|jgi:hypothetical protein|nr:hypothetical protein [Prevotella sp.]
MKRKVKYKSVRAWLLANERHDDVAEFDKSDEAKEEYFEEMAWSEYNKNMPYKKIVVIDGETMTIRLTKERLN